MTKRMNWVASVLLWLPLVLVLSVPATAEEQEELEIRPALLVVDVQNIWLPRMAEGDRNTAPENINKAIALFRESGNPIYAVYHSDPKYGPEPGTEPFRFPDWVAVTADDPVIVKAHTSAFKSTELDSLLKQNDRNAVYLCGLSAVGCVLATYFGAVERDYITYMIDGALLSHDSSYTRVIEEICSAVRMDDLAAQLEEQK